MPRRRDSKKLKWPGCCSVLLARTEPHTLSGALQKVQWRYRNPHLMPNDAPQSTDEVPVEGGAASAPCPCCRWTSLAVANCYSAAQ